MRTRKLNAPKLQEFPSCPFAQNETGVGLRECDHPGLHGLKLVTPKLCSGCYYREAANLGSAPHREHDSLSIEPELPRLWDCAYLASGGFEQTEPRPNQATQKGGSSVSQSDHPLISLEHWLETPQDCRHPAYEQTTRRECRRCVDYLFPRFSPRMSVDDARRLLVAQREPQPNYWWNWSNVQAAFRQLADDAIPKFSDYPSSFSGRGIVIAGGGRYFPSAYVTIRVLRHVGCRLPIQLWHLAGEMDATSKSILSPYGVTCVDAEELRARQNLQFHPTWWKGWQLKPYAILNAPFEEVLYLDADSYPTRNPEFLFNWSGYREQGAVFWPDIDNSAVLLPHDRPPIFGVPRFEDRPTESGQLMIHKRECWQELNLAWFYNDHAEFTYRILWGDKDTFPMAWKKLGRRYARMWPTSNANGQAVLQYDDAGCLLFQHRATDKFRLPGTRFDSTQQRPGANQYNPNLVHEDFCFAALNELRELLVEKSHAPPVADH